jgi:hypothetical protein
MPPDLLQLLPHAINGTLLAGCLGLLKYIWGRLDQRIEGLDQRMTTLDQCVDRRFEAREQRGQEAERQLAALLEWQRTTTQWLQRIEAKLDRLMETMHR